MTAADQHGWKFALVGDDEAHVFPVGDKEHDLAPSCWCAPTSEVNEGVMVFSHNRGTLQ